MKILLTGAQGFLGWHTRVRLRAKTDHEVVSVGRTNWSALPQMAEGVDAIIHCAGVNRAHPNVVEAGNLALAAAVGEAVRQGAARPRVVYANSVQAGTDSPYGRGKQTSSELLAASVSESGGTYVDVRLPNLFGEHCRPNYNSFVATFVDALVHGRDPAVNDREVWLLHAQDAAESLIQALTDLPGVIEPRGTRTTVQGILDTLLTLRGAYASSDIPYLAEKIDIDLFNTLRAALFPAYYPVILTLHSDQRGRLVEAVRTHGGQGQAFISTTVPGATRGEHFHLRKIERFVVVSGEARICLRKMFTEEVVYFDVTGREPAVVDMPTLWTHNITNTGHDSLTTVFWTHGLFDPKDPDTYPEQVVSAAS